MSTYSDIIIHCAENCSNSPKKELLKELTIAFAKNDVDYFLNFAAADVTWEIIGNRQIKGKEYVDKILHAMKFENIEQLIIHNVITHGNTGSVNGTVLCKHKNIHFCNVYKFSSLSKDSKISAITSYIINTKRNQAV